MMLVFKFLLIIPVSNSLSCGHWLIVFTHLWFSWFLVWRDFFFNCFPEFCLLWAPFILFIYFWPHAEACRNLSFWLGLNLHALQWKRRFLTTDPITISHSCKQSPCFGSRFAGCGSNGCLILRASVKLLLSAWFVRCLWEATGPCWEAWRDGSHLCIVPFVKAPRTSLTQGTGAPWVLGPLICTPFSFYTGHISLFQEMPSFSLSSSK